MAIRPIKNDDDYYSALGRLEVIFDAPVDSPEGDEAEVLALLIEDFENKYYPIDLPDPIDAIKIRMEEMGLIQKDLTGIIGSKGRVSEIMNRKRKLNLSMIRKLSELLNLPAEILIQDYPLEVQN
ncbi:MAG: helix-turn-helix domain-containing protein [Bacteroidota bacterium]